MKLTEEQKNVLKGLLSFKKDIQTLGGYAGTGKTTILKHLKKALPTFAVCAFTGKASDVLRKKEIPDASTIHSLIYKIVADEYGNPILDRNGNIQFELNPFFEGDGFIVDEASMISQEIYEDLLFFEKPIIFVGDHGQLEPVGEGLNLMENPDFTLETIHRNAGPIAYFAEHIRKGNPAITFSNCKEVEFISNWDSQYYITAVEQIICAFNKTRCAMNHNVREELGLDHSFPQVNDKIICLKNNKKLGIFNGMQGHIKKLFKLPKNKMLFKHNDIEQEILFDPSQFYKEKTNQSYSKDDPDLFDYSYCITCHKAQGDEFKSVMVIEQKCQYWDHKRWAYTAASRAKNKVVWVS